MTNDQRGAPEDTVTDLIVLGRDREAVAAATRDIQRGEAMDGVQQLDEIIPLLRSVVDRITHEQLDNPTPCATFSVASVLEHMIGGATAFAPAFRGEAPSAAAPDVAAGAIEDRWRRAMADLLSAVHSPGAQERTIASPFGEVPGSSFARYVAFDGLIHGWDLSVATGQSYAPPEPVVAEVDAFIRQLLTPEMRDGDTFAAETTPAADANPIEQLVAFSGRQIPDNS